MPLFCWSLGWTVDRNWQNRWRPECLVLTSAQVNSLPLRFFHPLSGCLGLRRRSSRIVPHFYETNTFSDWQTGHFSSKDLVPTVRLSHDPDHDPKCRWGYHPDTWWQRYRAFLPGSCWYSPGSWPEHWINRTTSSGTQSDHIWFEKLSSTYHLL